MLRNEGGSLGIAIVTTMVDRRSQFHQQRLAEHVRPTSRAVRPLLDTLTQNQMTRSGVSAITGEQQGFGLIGRMVYRRRASSLTSTYSTFICSWQSPRFAWSSS